MIAGYQQPPAWAEPKIRDNLGTQLSQMGGVHRLEVIRVLRQLLTCPEIPSTRRANRRVAETVQGFETRAEIPRYSNDLVRIGRVKERPVPVADLTLESPDAHGVGLNSQTV